MHFDTTPLGSPPSAPADESALLAQSSAGEHVLAASHPDALAPLFVNELLLPIMALWVWAALAVMVAMIVMSGVVWENARFWIVAFTILAIVLGTAIFRAYLPMIVAVAGGVTLLFVMWFWVFDDGDRRDFLDRAGFLPGGGR